MQDFDELKKLKAQCLSDIREALPLYANRLNECDGRLMIYIEDAISNNASHANLYELLGIRKEMRLMDSYDLDPERVKRSLRAIEGVWKGGRHVKGGLRFSTPRGSSSPCARTSPRTAPPSRSSTTWCGEGSSQAGGQGRPVRHQRSQRIY